MHSPDPPSAVDKRREICQPWFCSKFLGLPETAAADAGRYVVREASITE